MRIPPSIDRSVRRQRTRRTVRMGVLGLFVAALAGCWADARIGRSEPPASPAAPRAAPARPLDAVQWLRRHAIHILLVPLLDEETPSRWAVRTADDPCFDDGDVTVDGVALDGGTALPTAFTVERRFRGCRLFADDRLELTGTVTLSVETGAASTLVAVVDARQLHIRSADGPDVRVGEVFRAEDEFPGR